MATILGERSSNLETVRTTALRKHKHVWFVSRLQQICWEDNPDAASLKTMLTEAKAQTRVAPVDASEKKKTLMSSLVQRGRV